MKIDLIIPPGRHSWNLDQGWAHNLKVMGLLGTVKQASEKAAAEIINFASDSTADMILIMGGDHHMPFLHDSRQKRRRWGQLKTPVVCFCYETILESRFPGSKEKSESALEAFSHFAHCDEKDASFFESQGVPAIWLPQCVDHHHFHPPKPGIMREPLVYFRGKVDESHGYQQRRVILDFLREEKIAAISDSEISPQQLMEDYRTYAFAINLPGNFGGYNVRTFEALASGSVLLQYLPEDRPRNNALFEDRRHLFSFNYRNPKEVAALVREIRAHPDEAQRIAEAGRQECLARHTIEVRIRQLIEFVAQSHHISNKLHIGCGDNILRGFCNVDCRSLNPAVLVDDASKLSNVKDASYDLIYACHVLEHFSFHTVQGVLENWVRKLKPGGRIFLSVPNFRYLAMRYLLKGKIESVLPPLLGGQEYRENFHYCAFDKRSLGALMRKVGLMEVERFKAKDYDFTAHDCSRWPLSLNMVGRRGAT
jgi:hypothetical protein